MPNPKKKGRSKKQETKHRLLQLADRINEAWQRRAEDLLEMGKLLNKAKPLQKIKGFKQWVKDKLPFSYSSARNYMNIANAFESPDEVKQFSVRSLVLMSKRDFPKGLRHDIVESAKMGEEWDVERIQRKWDDAKEDIDLEELAPEDVDENCRKTRSKDAKATCKKLTKAEKTKAAIRHLSVAAKLAAANVGKRKKINPKAKSNYAKKIKKIQALLEAILKDLEKK
ncbi:MULTISPECIES: hypothetical protein [unclassified Pseudodesulfovibrio]|uniref:hypothetical protein n=1 Tax=unclassified Pseudodesulfovibrio TaxID=2661612 RepID=UPI000FEB6E30|nr:MULTISPECIES: hypothetical protein [unclassified Pseudodesulfovibrio]MCJ2164694.1 hypothetical protein [Pseudodesulfovibrio sp. S3-i]RWU04114.1 hypothetical protein DWB63_08900 [Pseudodesulfovibrio sp. S3]